MDMSSFDLQTVGALASIGGLLPSFVAWFTSEYRARRAKKKEEAKDIIEQYIEWLRRQRHDELLSKLSGSQEAMSQLHTLAKQLMAESTKGRKAILGRLESMDAGLHEKLDGIDSKIDRLSERGLRAEEQASRVSRTGEGGTYKVFISSTYEDLKEYRQKAIEVVNRYKCLPLAMEFFMSQPEEPTEVAKKEVEECDIFVGIYAHRYGFVPEGQKKSITEQEYKLAVSLGKDCLCFVVKDDFAWNPKMIESGVKGKLKAFRKTILKEHAVTFFTTIADLEGKVASSLGKQLAKKSGMPEEKKKIERGVKVIPVAPTPYIAHSYALPANFTGREAEKAMLSNWLHNAAEPMLVLEAIGGMGKTALGWVWLHEEVLERRAEVDGVFWWSFYEGPFEAFIEHLYFYVTSTRVKVERGALLSGDWETLNCIMHNNRFLLVLDGFERALRGYSDMRAMYRQEKGLRFDGAHHRPGGKEAEEWDRRQREAVHPAAGRFLEGLTGGETKTLMTSRLMPTALEGIGGVQHEQLKGLSRADAMRFLRSEGVEGSRAELESAGAVYNFHPLMLKLLSTAINRTRTKDIKEAFKLKLIDKKEPQKILNTSFGLLTEDEQKVAATVSVYRSSFSFDTAKALLGEMDEETLWKLLGELRQLGFIFYDEREEVFDFHPIMRSFLYDSLRGKGEVHERAAEYFEAMPSPEKVVTLEDLRPVIELYHHLVRAGKLDEALELYRERVAMQTHFQLAAYELNIRLLKELFVDGEGKPPRLKNEADQAWTANSLANSYSLSGQPGKAGPFFVLAVGAYEKNANQNSLAISMGNLACMAQVYIGRLSTAGAHLRKSIALRRDAGDKFEEAVGRGELGRVLAYQGRHGGRNTENAEDELAKSTEYFKESSDYQGLSVNCSYGALSALLEGRAAFGCRTGAKKGGGLSLRVLEEAGKALGFAETTVETVYPHPRDFVRAYWLMAEGLVQCREAGVAIEKGLEIDFYDEHFQRQTETLDVKGGDELEAAERCLDEALRRCRGVNMVLHEADILLGCARLEWAKGKNEKKLAEIEVILKEAQGIAERGGYRLQLADIHLFCAEVLIEAKGGEMLRSDARGHIGKAREYAKDVSEFGDLFKSKDAGFYEGIEGYEMLKRGMTDEERIKNGYYVAWQIADGLEGRLGG